MTPSNRWLPWIWHLTIVSKEAQLYSRKPPTVSKKIAPFFAGHEAPKTVWVNRLHFGGKNTHQRCFQLWKLKCLNRQKRGLVYSKKLVFKGKRRKIHIHQRAFKVVVGDPFAQHWCIDFGLLSFGLAEISENPTFLGLTGWLKTEQNPPNRAMGHLQQNPSVAFSARLNLFFFWRLLSEKHRAREPRNLTHKLSHESAHENAHGSVHEDVHGNAREGWGFLCETPRKLPWECSREVWQCSRTWTGMCARSIFTCHLAGKGVWQKEFGKKWRKMWQKHQKKTFSKQGSTPTPWAQGLRDQVQKWARETQKTLYF